MSNSSDSRLYFEGVLDKAGKRFFEGFRKRWFTLDGQYLTYYKAPEKTEENCLGTIDFSQVKAVNPSKVTNNGFQITTKSRTYTFSAPSSDLQTEWISLLRQAMQLESFVRCNSRLSAQDSIDSQYEEIPNAGRGSCGSQSEKSFDEDDNDVLYSGIDDHVTLKSTSEYSQVGAVTMPMSERSKNGGETEYELVGSRPSSKSAPPTYEMVKAATQDTLENAGGLYDLVAAPPKVERKRKDTGPTKQNITTGRSQTDDNENPVEDNNHLYCTVPKGVRKQNNSFRGLSMISEGEQDEEDEEQPSPAPEEESPALPPRKCSEEALAIFEIKRFLEESAKGERENETCDEGKEANNNTGNLTQNGTGSAFQQLKAFLQQLDSTEEE